MKDSFKEIDVTSKLVSLTFLFLVLPFTVSSNCIPTGEHTAISSLSSSTSTAVEELSAECGEMLR